MPEPYNDPTDEDRAEYVEDNERRIAEMKATIKDLSDAAFPSFFHGSVGEPDDDPETDEDEYNLACPRCVAGVCSAHQDLDLEDDVDPSTYPAETPE